MADDLRVAILLSVDGKQAVGELKIARAELAGLSAEAKRSGLSQGLKDSTGHARNLASEIKSIGPAIGVAFTAGAIVNFVRQVGAANIQLQKTQATLTFATGSAVEAAKGYEFAAGEAQRLGLEVQSTALQYAKFSASAKGTALSAAEVKTVFAGVVEASRALGLSTGETENAIRALVQMLSKGKITAEEFRGQLGDALPGATRIAAKALGVTTEEFSRMLDEGELTLDFVAKFGDALHKEFGGTATQAAKGLAAELNRLSNEWTEMQIALGESGGIQVAIVAIQGLSAALKGLGRGFDALGGFSTADAIVKRAAKEAESYESIAKRLGLREPGRGNQVPGGASAVPRPRSNERDIFDDARLAKSQRALESLAKAEAAAHKQSLGRTRELASEEQQNHQAALRHTSDLAKAQEDAWKERAEQLNDLARIQNEGLDHTEDLIAEEAQAWERLDNERADAIQEQQRLEERAADERTQILEREVEQQSRIMSAPFENALEGIQGSFVDAFEGIFSGGVDTFKDLGETIKSIFIRLAAEIAALMVFRPVVSGILGGIGLGGVSGALGLGGGGAGGVGGGFMDLLSGGSSASSLFGGPSLFSGLTGGINSFGQSLGFGLGPSFVGPLPAGAGTLTSASLSSVLGGAGVGAAGGGIISSLMGGNTTVGTVAGGVLGAGGAALGAAYGSFGGPIGMAIGAILGGILGGIMKETPPRGHTVHEVGFGTVREFGKKGFDPDSFDPLTKGIDKAIVDLGKLLKISTEGARYFIGFDQEKGFSAAPDVYEKNEEALKRKIVLNELAERAETPFQKAALSRASENKRLSAVVESIGRDVSFKKDFEKFVKDAGRPRDLGAEMAKELRAMDREFKKMRKHAEDLDLSMKGFAQATKRVKDEVKDRFADEFKAEFESLVPTGPSDLAADIKEWEKAVEAMRGGAIAAGMSMEEFDQAVREGREVLISEFKDRFDAFKSFGEPRDLGAELHELQEEFTEMRRIAQDLGLSLEGFDEAAQRATAAWIAEQQASVVSQIRSNIDALGITSLQAFRDQLDVSPDLAPMVRLQNAMRQFEEVRARALAGELDAVQALPGIGQLLLDLHRQIYASGPQAAAFTQELETLLDGLISTLTPEGYNPNDLLQAGVNQVEELRRQTTLLLQQLDELRRLSGGQAAASSFPPRDGPLFPGPGGHPTNDPRLLGRTRPDDRSIEAVIEEQTAVLRRELRRLKAA